MTHHIDSSLIRDLFVLDQATSDTHEPATDEITKISSTVLEEMRKNASLSAEFSSLDNAFSTLSTSIKSGSFSQKDLGPINHTVKQAIKSVLIKSKVRMDRHGREEGMPTPLELEKWASFFSPAELFELFSSYVFHSDILKILDKHEIELNKEKEGNTKGTSDALVVQLETALKKGDFFQIIALLRKPENWGKEVEPGITLFQYLLQHPSFGEKALLMLRTHDFLQFSYLNEEDQIKFSLIGELQLSDKRVLTEDEKLICVRAYIKCNKSVPGYLFFWDMALSVQSKPSFWDFLFDESFDKNPVQSLEEISQKIKLMQNDPSLAYTLIDQIIRRLKSHPERFTTQVKFAAIQSIRGLMSEGDVRLTPAIESLMSMPCVSDESAWAVKQMLAGITNLEFVQSTKYLDLLALIDSEEDRFRITNEVIKTHGILNVIAYGKITRPEYFDELLKTFFKSSPEQINKQLNLMVTEDTLKKLFHSEVLSPIFTKHLMHFLRTSDEMIKTHGVFAVIVNCNITNPEHIDELLRAFFTKPQEQIIKHLNEMMQNKNFIIFFKSLEVSQVLSKHLMHYLRTNEDNLKWPLLIAASKWFQTLDSEYPGRLTAMFKELGTYKGSRWS